MPNALTKFYRLAATRGLPALLRTLSAAALDACRQRRFVVDASAGHCGYGTAWRWPTRCGFVNALRRRLGITEDFRRRAVTCPEPGEPLPEVPATSTVLLAGAAALADARVRQFLLAEAAAGQLRLIHADDIRDPQPGRVTVLCGVEADADGQACLLGLRRRGIACVWLTASGEVPAQEVPLKEACSRQATLSDDARALEFTQTAVPQGLTFHRRAQPAPRRPLRVLTYRWHVPHQYELFKLEAEFTLVADLGEGSCRWWDLGQRPLPANARFAHWRDIDPREFDLAILHFDENVLHPAEGATAIGADWGKTFRFLRQHLTIPQVAVCHGTRKAADRFDGQEAARQAEASRAAMVGLLADVPVVVNSHQAQAEWAFRQSRVIWHGFDPQEFPARHGPPNRPARILTLPQDALAERPYCRGLDLLDRVADSVNAPLERLRVPEPNLLLGGNAYARAKFAHYVAALHRFDIYFNPTLHSPMPRSRGEAMLCGLATINADSHDADRFIENGINGYIADSPEELAGHLRRLAGDPDLAWRIGRAGRETAVRVFHVDRYLGDWRRLIRDVLGSDAI